MSDEEYLLCSPYWGDYLDLEEEQQEYIPPVSEVVLSFDDPKDVFMKRLKQVEELV